MLRYFCTLIDDQKYIKCKIFYFWISIKNPSFKDCRCNVYIERGWSEYLLVIESICEILDNRNNILYCSINRK